MLLDEIDPATVSESPETVKLWFPSQLPRDSCEGLPHLEFRLRLAQAYDALDLIRRLRGVYHAILLKNQVHVSNSNGTMTRAKSVFTNFSFRIDQAAARYRDARLALLRLDPNEELSRWKKDLQELHRQDIRGPAREAGEKSESLREMSWIWKTSSLRDNTGINDPDLQPIMRVEWCKATARAERFEEEVELVVEEMRRTLAFFEWSARSWEEMGGVRASEPKISSATVIGLKAYAVRKATLFRRLIVVFLQDWYECLEHKSLGSDWLTRYPRPTFIRRRRLPSMVTAYHFPNPCDMENTDDALASDPSDAEAMETASDFEKEWVE